MRRSRGQVAASLPKYGYAQTEADRGCSKVSEPVDGYSDQEDDNRSLDNLQGGRGAECEVILSK